MTLAASAPICTMAPDIRTGSTNALGQATSITDPLQRDGRICLRRGGQSPSLTYPGGSVVDYSYDAADRLTLVNGPSTIVNYAYDAANRVTNVTRPNGIQTHYSYDPMGRIKSILHQSGTEVLASYTYSLDNVGNRIQTVERLAAPLGPPPTSAPSQTASPTLPFTETATGTASPISTEYSTPTPPPTETPTVSAIDTPLTGVNQDEQRNFRLASFPLGRSTKAPTPSRTPTASKTPTPSESTFTPTSTQTSVQTATASLTPTSTNTIDPNLVNTGWKTPTTDTALPWGDGDGFELNPMQAFADDGLFALDNNSGTSTTNDCSDWSNYDTTNFQSFNFNIPAGASIRGLEVRIDAKVDAASSNARMCVWDHPSPLLQTAENTYIMGGPNDRWGRTWTASDFTNSSFYLEIANAAQSRLRDFSLDSVEVKVYYVAPPTKTPTATRTITPSATPSPTLTPTDTATPTITPTPTRTPHNTGTPINIPTFSDATTTATRQPTSAPTDLPTPCRATTKRPITYEYDPLYRLTAADYSSGAHYHYTYDAVGNRLSQETGLGITNYVYDDANRLSSVNGVSYTWDNNGNLLQDGVNAYTYDSANRLTALSNSQSK
jgi:YD repeat-containing protein